MATGAPAFKIATTSFNMFSETGCPLGAKVSSRSVITPPNVLLESTFKGTKSATSFRFLSIAGKAFFFSFSIIFMTCTNASHVAYKPRGSCII